MTTRVSIVLALAAAFFATLAAPISAAGADVTVTASVSGTRVYVGDSIDFQITVDGVQGVPAPDLSTLDGFAVQFAGGHDQSSRSVTIINGRMQEHNSLRYIMAWKLTPLRPGTLTIPPVPVSIGGQPYSTQAITIVASEPGESKDFKLRLEAARTTAYVGEPVKLTLTWYLGKQVRNVQFTGSDGGRDFDIGPGADPRPGGREDQRFPVVPLLGMQAVGRIGQGDMGGVATTTFTLEMIVTPRRAGELTVGPFSAVFQAVVGQRPSSFFDAPWDDRSVVERVVIASNPVTLDVRELPERGRPANFTGLIGEYGITASAATGEANVGDPIPLTVRITGPDPMDRVQPPELGPLDAFGDFKLSPEGWQPGSISPGERTFTTIIRPRTDRISEIPPIELAYFDTGAGRYGVAASDPIPLKVNPTREVTSADAIGAVLSAPSAAPAKALDNGRPGIRANYEGDDALANQDIRLLHLARTPLGAAALLTPPLACAGAALVRRRRAAATPAGRRRRALAQSRHTLRRADSCDGIGAAFRAYLGAALSAEPAAITSTDCRALARSAGPLAERAERLLAECERARFGPAARPVNELRNEASRLLAELDHELGRVP